MRTFFGKQDPTAEKNVMVRIKRKKSTNKVFSIMWNLYLKIYFAISGLVSSRLKFQLLGNSLICIFLIWYHQKYGPPNNLCHNHKWPIKAAKQNGVTYLKMTNYNSHEKWSKVRLNLRNDNISSDYFLFIFQKYWYWKILEVSVFNYLFEIRSISISIWKSKY